MSEVFIKEVDGYDVVQYQPKGVCAKMMQFRIKDNIIHLIKIKSSSLGIKPFFTAYKAACGVKNVLLNKTKKKRKNMRRKKTGQ